MDGRLELLRGVVHPWHEDHFGHMNVRHYAPFFDDAGYHMWTRMGLGYADMLARYRIHCVAAQCTTSFLKELTAGDLILIDGAVGRIGTKSCTFVLRMFNADSAVLHATYEVVEVFFDPGSRQATAMPDEVRGVLERHLAEDIAG